MRIAIVSQHLRRFGGREAYLGDILPHLVAYGHEISFYCENDSHGERPVLGLPEGTTRWNAEDLGPETAMAEMKQWRPDVVYVHGLGDPRQEKVIAQNFASVYFTHDYRGTCISGLKTTQLPIPRPCERCFSWRCLLHYFPRHCGGWNPYTMIRLFWVQAMRLAAMRRYGAIVTNSAHMRAEYIRHRFPEARVHKIPFPVTDHSAAVPRDESGRRSGSTPSRLLFVGRMDRLKGAAVLLEAVEMAAAALDRSLFLTLAGDGPERGRLQQQAADVSLRNPAVNSSFIGWVETSQLQRVYSDADLVVVPSLWPEPFGMVGIEAGFFGIPSVAFDAGGITEWLHDGRNGRTAPSDPPTADGLANAIVDCIKDKAEYQRLSEGAHETAQRFTAARHIDALTEVFQRTAGV